MYARRDERGFLFFMQLMAHLAKKKKIVINHFINCDGLRIEVNTEDGDE